MFSEITQGFRDTVADGQSDPKIMAAAISMAIVRFGFFVILALPGWIAGMYIVLYGTVRSREYFRFLVFMSVFFIIGFPLATLFGVIMAIALFKKRQQFK